MEQPLVVKYGDGRTDRVDVPIASATTIEKGDFISYESNKAVLMDNVGEDDTFCGMAETTSTNGDTENLVVLTKCIAEVDTTSATYTIGQGLMYTSENTLVAAGSDTAIAWSTEYKTSCTRLRVLIDVVALQKLFVDAGA